MNTTHQILRIEDKPAEYAGCLDGFAAVCSCGEKIGSSLRTCAELWGREHVNYMNAKEVAR